MRLLREAAGGVALVSCGADHMAAIDDLGRMWVWGGRFGESPQRIQLPEPMVCDEEGGVCKGGGDGGGEDDTEDRVRDSGCAWTCGASLVACGAECVLAVSDAGECFVWGNGEHGRLGLGDSVAEHETPQRLTALSCPAMRVHAAACGRGLGSLDEGPTMRRGQLFMRMPPNLAPRPTKSENGKYTPPPFHHHPLPPAPAL